MTLVRFYQSAISPWIGPRCRFHPSCSEYVYQSFKRYPFYRAAGLGLKRIAKCHPFHPGGVDYVP